MKVKLMVMGLFIVLGCSSNQDQKHTSMLRNIINPANRGASLPYLVNGNDGKLYFSWIEQSAGSSTLLFASYSSEWSQPQVIANGTDWFLNWADYPMIAENKGVLIAHYLAKSSTGTYSYDVNITVRKDEAWSKAFIPHTDGTPTEHGFVTMLPLTDSTFQVAWLDGRNTGIGDHYTHGHGGGAMTLRTAVIDSHGQVSERTELDNQTCDCCQTSGAITATGPIFVYRDRSALEMRDISIVRKVKGQWMAPQTVATDNWNITGCPVNGPRADAINQIVGVAWYTAAMGQPQVKVAFSADNGESFANPIIVDRQTPIGRVDLEMLDEQSAMVTWLTKVGNRSLIKAQKVFINGSKESAFVISETSESRASGFPQMTKLGKEVFFAWTAMEDSVQLIRTAKITF